MKTSQLPVPVLRRLLLTMLRIRAFEDAVVAVYPEQNMKTPVHLSTGQEAVAAGVCAHLERRDTICTNHRNHGHCLAKGVPPLALAAECFGRKAGCAGGKGGSMHPVAPRYGIYGTSAIVGGGVPHAVGQALAAKMDHSPRVSVAFFGDGAMEEGSSSESLNFAALHRLPVLFVCENNGYGASSALCCRQPNEDISARAKAYGIRSARVDGNNVVEVYKGARNAVAAVRQGQGPFFHECLTYRWYRHMGVKFDQEQGVRPWHELRSWQLRCPIKVLESVLGEEAPELAALVPVLMARQRAAMDAVMVRAQRLPFPDPEDALGPVFWS